MRPTQQKADKNSATTSRLPWFEKEKLVISVKKFKTAIFITAGVLSALIIGALIYRISYDQNILPRVTVGDIKVGGMTQDAAVKILEQHFGQFAAQGLRVKLDDEHGEEIIPTDTFNPVFDAQKSALTAQAVGRSGPWYQRLKYWLKAPFLASDVIPALEYDTEGVRSEVDGLAIKHDQPRKDIRYAVSGTKVTVLTDTAAGQIVDRESAVQAIERAIGHLSQAPVNLTFVVDSPRADPQFIDEAKRQAERVLAGAVTLKANQKTITLEPTQIGQWLISAYDDTRLLPGIDDAKVAEYVSGLAAQVNSDPEAVKVRVENGQVIDFAPAKSGTVLEEKEATELIRNALLKRSTELTSINEIALPVTVKKPLGGQTAAELGIKEQVGAATTPFTGSPSNRIHNISTGTRLLSGIIIQPGEEFSTIKALGAIDASSGFLPELVIKGNRTIPEFGGGLCQVSTTLFRAVLNAGLPVTSRQNHSYRVSYYEKDGDGRDIGPGLDATIYSPRPDFKFKNDTGKAILIQGSVKGNKVSFELYGTKDGRTAVIDGPKTLTTVPPGDPITTETDTLPPGETKQIETPHPGGRATATYTVRYADGRTVTVTFNSYYRPWPAQFLVGKQPTP